MEEPASAIIFCKTKKDVDDLGEALQNKGFNAETLHGDMNQSLRDRVMGRFRSGQSAILVATDVAARGLDIDQVTHVFNFDLPWDTESYIHRIGRTGRAGRTGDAITLISPRDRHQIRMLEKQIKAPITAGKVPTPADIARRHRERFQKEVEAALEAGDFDREALIVEAITEKTDWTTAEIAAAAMSLLWKSRRLTDFDLEAAREIDERTEPGMVRLFLQIGRQDNVRPGDIVCREMAPVRFQKQRLFPTRAHRRRSNRNPRQFLDTPHELLCVFRQFLEGFGSSRRLAPTRQRFVDRGQIGAKR